MNNYNEIVSKVRDLARDQVRLHAVNRYRTEKYEQEQHKTCIENDIAELKKNILRAEFKKSEVKANDPDFESKVKTQDDNIQGTTDAIGRVQKIVEIVEKRIAELVEKITKVESGETKMAIENVEAASKALIDEFVKAQAKELTA